MGCWYSVHSCEPDRLALPLRFLVNNLSFRMPSGYTLKRVLNNDEEAVRDV